MGFLLELRDPVLLLRRGNFSQPGPVEAELARIAKILGWRVEWYQPKLGGREENFYRDMEMLSEADLCIGLFAEDDPMSGGTGHLVEKAQDLLVPAYAFAWNGRTYLRLGEYDVDDQWASRLRY